MINFDLRICESMACKIFVAPGFIAGIVNARGKKVRPQKWQKAKTLHAPQNKKPQISTKVCLWQNVEFRFKKSVNLWL